MVTWFLAATQTSCICGLRVLRCTFVNLLGCPRGPTLCYSATFARHQPANPTTTGYRPPTIFLLLVPPACAFKKTAWTGSGSRGEGWETFLGRRAPALDKANRLYIWPVAGEEGSQSFRNKPPASQPRGRNIPGRPRRAPQIWHLNRAKKPILAPTSARSPWQTCRATSWPTSPSSRGASWATRSRGSARRRGRWR